MHPLKKGRRREQILAVMYYLQEWEYYDSCTTGQIREGLIRARIPQAKTINISQALARADPYVDKVGQDNYRLTNRGLEAVIEFLNIGSEHAEIHDLQAIQKLAKTIDDETIRSYIDEAILCLSVDAKRAAVVFLWSAVVAEVRSAVWAEAEKPADIETAIQKRNPKLAFKRLADFENVNDAVLIEITDDFGIYGKAHRKRLKEGLDLRNDCGHPVTFRPGEKKVSSFIEDMLQVAWGAS